MEQRQLEAQLGWMGELEMAFNGLENDLQRLGSTFSRDSSMARTTLQKLKVCLQANIVHFHLASSS